MAGRSTRSLAIVEAAASRIAKAELVVPALVLIGTAAATYAIVVMYPVVFLYTPAGIFPVLVALGCITAEIIAVPHAISAMAHAPSLRTPANLACVVIGIGVVSSYGLFFWALMG